MKVKPEELKQHQERLKYEVVEESDTDGVIQLSWDKVGITVPEGTK